MNPQMLKELGLEKAGNKLEGKLKLKQKLAIALVLLLLFCVQGELVIFILT